MSDDAAIAIGERLAGIYRAIRSGSMRSAPICNDALDVEAVGFRAFGEWTIGVVLTPWMMNVVAVHDGAAGPSPSRPIALPAGDVAFVASRLDGFGPILACSLFSPMSDFMDMASAREAAKAALAALFDSRLLVEPVTPSPVIGRRDVLRGKVGEAPRERD